jgi:hypothetical protein
LGTHCRDALRRKRLDIARPDPEITGVLLLHQRPAEEVNPAHSTLFQQRPGQAAHSGGLQPSIKRLARAILAPVLVNTYWALKMKRLSARVLGA